jgi:hypothetical protein
MSLGYRDPPRSQIRRSNVKFWLRCLLAGMLTAAALSGCVASTNPIGPPEAAVEEPRLFGVWIAAAGGAGDHAWEYLHILPRGDDRKHLDIVVANHGEKTWVVFDGYVTAVAGGRQFVDLRVIAADAATMAQIAKYEKRDIYPYSFAAIAFESDGRLKAAYAGEVLATAVRDGKLAGETQGDWDVFVSAPSAAIADVLAGADEAVLFAKAVHYKRLGP